MEEDTQEKRQRCQNFTDDEIQDLLRLVDKYKLVILNKCITGSANRVKEEAWTIITRVFNNKKHQCVRSVDNLKNKWRNLCSWSNKVSRNGLVIENDENVLYGQVNNILSQADSIPAYESQSDLRGELINIAGDEANHVMLWNDAENQAEGENEGTAEDTLLEDANDKKSRVRSMNFSPQDCVLLLRCVRQEKQHIFNTSSSLKDCRLKNRAWLRVTQNYNKLSPNKRDTKTLINKFRNIKTLSRRVGFKGYFKVGAGKHNRFDNESTPKKIKKEPSSESQMDDDSDNTDDDDIFNDNTPNDIREYNASIDYLNKNENEIHLDPLSSAFSDVLDSKLGSSNIDPCQQSENSEVVRLKMELLKYQMETAKMERKRLEDSLREDALSRETLSLAHALRLRAARLDAVAAAERLPPAHPARGYPPEEARAEAYMNSFHLP